MSLRRAWLATAVADAEICTALGDATVHLLRAIRGPREAQEWPVVRVKLNERDERGRRLSYSDSPVYLNGLLILRRAAARKLSTVLESAQLLPLACKEADLVALCVPSHDVLDESKSELIRGPSGSLLLVRALALREVPRDSEVFHVAGLEAMATLVTDTFVDEWHANDLVGLEFLPLDRIHDRR